MMEEQKTLTEAIRYFSNEQNCIDTIAAMRWPDGKPACPHCNSLKHYWLAAQRRWKCAGCRKQFSVKVGTALEDSALSLDKWLIALWMLVNCKNGISSYEVAKTVGVTQKTAWFMLQRLRLVLQDDSTSKLQGTVEVDETFIGGKARNMHGSKRRKAMDRKNKSKTIVLGFLERGGMVRTEIVGDRMRPTLQGKIKKHVESGSQVFTDELHSYWGLNEEYAHQVINHAYEYVQGHVHTNSLENFWCLVKRALGGTYVSVAPFHLFRYIDEQAFRYNHRGTKKFPISNVERFQLALSRIAGKRLTYAQVTGQVAGSC